jgi:hypothetical protein
MTSNGIDQEGGKAAIIFDAEPGFLKFKLA